MALIREPEAWPSFMNNDNDAFNPFRNNRRVVAGPVRVYVSVFVCLCVCVCVDRRSGKDNGCTSVSSSARSA